MKVKHNGDWVDIPHANPNDYYTKTEVDSKLDSFIAYSDGFDIGTILMWSSSNIPEGWLICDGRFVSKTEYPELYAIIGDQFSSYASINDEFALPDLIDKYVYGTTENGDEPGTTREEYVASNDINISGLLSYGELQAYDTSGMTWSAATNTINILTCAEGTIPPEDFVVDTISVNDLNFSTSSIGYDNGAQVNRVTPNSIALLYIIKAKNVLGTAVATQKKFQEVVAETNTYSTEEQRIGTWVDGKPIYRKLFTLNNAKNGDIIDIAELNVEHSIKIDGFVIDPTQIHIPILYYNYTSSAHYISAYVNSGATRLVYICSPSYSQVGHTAYITLEYTKTTD